MRSDVLLEILRALLFGTIQGITEWLPISSTGHMLLLDRFIKLESAQDREFFDLFLVVIQLASVLAVAIVFRKKLFPTFAFYIKKSNAVPMSYDRKSTFVLWQKILIGVVPLGIVGLAFDDIVEKYLYGPLVIAGALIVYGIAFIAIEKSRALSDKVSSLDDLTKGKAFGIGLFQTLALIPGTSRSGSTIIGARLLSVSREAAAEFSFFLAIPVMFGASALKVLKYVMSGASPLTLTEYLVLAFGCLSSFAVSLVTVKYLTGYVKRHSFIPFGIYRILLGIVIILYFVFK